MNLLTRLRELSDSNYSISLVMIENRELKALLGVVEAAKECTRFYAIPGETWEKLEDCVSALERE